MIHPSRAVLGVILFNVIIAWTIPSIWTMGSFQIMQASPNLTVDPSSLVIKVGDNAKANVTLTNLPISFGLVCFGVEDFPSSGFVTSNDPTCVKVQPSNPALSVLTVEATPAAAPQSFTAYVVATSGNWTGRTPINITVEPAMPAWIPWSIILAFILILVIPLMIKTKKTKTSRRK